MILSSPTNLLAAGLGSAAADYVWNVGWHALAGRQVGASAAGQGGAGAAQAYLSESFGPFGRSAVLLHSQFTAGAPISSPFQPILVLHRGVVTYNASIGCSVGLVQAILNAP